MGLFGNISKKIFNTAKIKKRDFDPAKMSAEDITLPFSIAKTDNTLIKGLLEHYISAYKSLGYKNKNAQDLGSIKEYSSYEIGVLLKYIKDNQVYSIPNKEKILPDFILNISKKQLHLKVFDLVHRYEIGVNKTLNIEELKMELKWTPLDMGYILYYINLSNRTI